MSAILFAIDIQNDFCDPAGALFVPGAVEDTRRVSTFLDEQKIDGIIASMDVHSRMDIAHPMFWVDQDGRHPEPFTMISVEDLQRGRWRTLRQEDTQVASAYVLELERRDRFQLCIWPPHCLYGTAGAQHPEIFAQALKRWELGTLRSVEYVLKGQFPFSEHYSALQAEVPNELIKETLLNVSVLDRLRQATRIYVAGQALSHCVASTLDDIAQFAPEVIQNIVMYRSMTSSVPGFEALGQSCIERMVALGMEYIED